MGATRSTGSEDATIDFRLKADNPKVVSAPCLSTTQILIGAAEELNFRLFGVASLTRQ